MEQTFLLKPVGHILNKQYSWIYIPKNHKGTQLYIAFSKLKQAITYLRLQSQRN